MRALSEWALFDPKETLGSVSNGAAKVFARLAMGCLLRRH